MSDAPDYEHVFTLGAAMTDAPDWQETAVGPGGVPIGSSFANAASGLGGETYIAPGSSITQNFTPDFGGTLIGMLIVCLTSLTTAGNYLVRAQPLLTGPGGISGGSPWVTGSLYVPAGATKGTDLTLIVPFVADDTEGGDTEIGVTVWNDTSSPDDVQYGGSSQTGLSFLSGAVVAGG